MLRYDFEIPDDFEMVAERADEMAWEKIKVHVHFHPVLLMTQENEREMLEKEGIVIGRRLCDCGRFFISGIR